MHQRLLTATAGTNRLSVVEDRSRRRDGISAVRHESPPVGCVIQIIFILYLSRVRELLGCILAFQYHRFFSSFSCYFIR